MSTNCINLRLKQNYQRLEPKGSLNNRYTDI